MQDDVQAVDIPIKDSYITIYDSEYPDSLRKLRFPPWVCFICGDISLLRKPMLTIIGSRQMNSYAKWLVEESVGHLKERFVLVSGLAKGVDGYVHTIAIKVVIRLQLSAVAWIFTIHMKMTISMSSYRKQI